FGSFRHRGTLHEIKNNKYEKALIEYLSMQEIDCFIDIGANIGFFTVALGDRYKSAISVEPDPLNTPYLFKNICINNISQKVIIVISPLADVGIDRVHWSSNQLNPALSSAGSVTQYPQVWLKALSVKDILGLQNLSGNVTIKVDVEGLEFFILKDLENEMKKHSQ